MNKNEIRILVQEKISHMSEDGKKQENKNVCAQLAEILSKKEFKTIVTYQAFPDEVDITEVADWCAKNGKEVLIIPQSLVDFEIPENAVIIVPGRAFTREGKRIGRGSGYYDKLIERSRNSQTIGVCFHCQIFGDIPEESWDKRVGEVVFGGNILK